MCRPALSGCRLPLAILAFASLVPGDVTADEPARPASATSVASFFGDGRLTFQLRGYFMDRTFAETPLYPEVENAAFVLGGGLVYETAKWHGASLGFSVYTSQKVWAPPDKGGTNLLKDGESYSALAETFLQWQGGKTTVRLFRQRIDTPLLGSRDFRMVPYAWEAWTVEDRSVPGLAIQASWVTKVKDWTSSVFVPIGEWLGAPEIDAATGLLGLVYESPGRSISAQGWYVHTRDVIGTVYAQVDGRIPVGKGLWLTVSGQGISQSAVGAAVYPGAKSGIVGLRGALGWKGSELRLAGNVSSRDGEFLNLFGLYPGYTSIMEEDNNLAGEKSWLIGFTIDFAPVGAPGLTLAIDRTKSWVSEPALGMSGLDQFEFNADASYRFQGALKGLRLRARYANVDSALDQGSIYGRDFDDYRLNLEYTLPLSTGLRK